MSNDNIPAANPFDVQEGIFIHHVPEKEMQSTLLGKRKIEVPRGHVAVVIKDGQVHEVLPSGVQVAVGFWERLVGDSGKKSFYVVSLRPVGVLSQPVPVQDGAGRSTIFKALVQFSVPTKDKNRLGALVERVIGPNEFIEAATVRTNLTGFVEQTVTGSLVRRGDGTIDVAESEKSIQSKLTMQVEQFGFAVTASLSSGEQRMEVNVRLGEGPSPGLKRCVSCSELIQETKKFCNKCGTQQPISTNPSTSAPVAVATERPCSSCGFVLPTSKKFCSKCGTKQPAVDVAGPSASSATLTIPDDDKVFTVDGEPLAVDISLLVEGYQGRNDDERIQRAVKAAIRAALARVPALQISTRDGLTAFESSIRGDLERAVASVGGRLVHIGVLDVRQKTGEWLLQARSELERAKKEAGLDREWLERDAEEAEILALQYEVAMRRVQAELNADFARDEAAVADRERRAQLQDRSTDQDIADARRDSRRDIAIDAATRETDRARRANDQTDAIQSVVDGAQLDRARRDVDREERAYSRETERETLAHEQALERDVAAQDLKLRSDSVRAQANDESFVSRLQADDTLYAQRNQQNFADEVADRALDRKHKDADRSQERDLTAEDRRKKMRMEELQAMAQIEASMDVREKQHEMDKRKLEVDAEQSKLLMTTDHELKMRQELKGLSTDQMLAMQAGGANGGDLAAALAKKFEADAAAKKAEAEAALLGNKDLAAANAAAEAARARAEEVDRARERESAMQSQMMAMMQQMMSQNQAFAQSMVQSQVQVTQSALGNAQSSADRERDALKGAAAQAVAMSERSMGAMSQVATQAATHGPTVVMPTVGPGAGRPVAPTIVESQEASARPAQAASTKNGPWRCGNSACGSFNDPDEPTCSECRTPR